MLRFTLSLGAILLAGSVSQADVQVFKVLDGRSVYCDSSREASAQNEKVIQLSLIEERNSQDNQDTTLRVSLVKCQNNEWTEDLSPASETYIAPNGMKVEVQYTDFELLLVNKNYEVLLQTSLDHLNRGGFQDRTLSFSRSRDLPQDLDLLIRGRKHVKAEDGYSYSESFTFGGFRVRLK